MNGRKSGKNFANRRGALMLMLLVAIIIGGIIALRLLPQEEVIAQRDREEILHGNLSQIREAFDLKRQADPTWNPFPDLDNTTMASVTDVLEQLANENFLREKDVKDPTVPHYLWGTTSNYFWRVSENIASNTSFELEDPADPTAIASWTASPESVVATDTEYLSDSSVDDYPHQNKLGSILQSSGASLKITR